MRILVLSNLYPPHYVGGYELRCRDITEALIQRGHVVRVLTSDYRTPGAEEADRTGYTIERSLRLHGFFGNPWLGIAKLSKLEAHNNAKLIAAIGLFKPDLVHVWNLGGLSKSLALTLQRLNIPTVFDVSDHWIARSLEGDVWLNWWNRQSLSPLAKAARRLWTLIGTRRRMHTVAPTNPLRHLKFSRIYFCSSRLREITAKAGYDVTHGAVIHCPVNTRLYRGEVKPQSMSVKRLLYAGRLSQDKGILTALQAMRSLQGRSDVELHVYGKGEPEYEQMLKSYVATNKLPVSFHCATPEQMPEVYRQYDALLFTSEWEEPFALTPLEAMASGLPVIGTTTGGSAELFQNGLNSLTYCAGDAQALAKQILHLQECPETRVSIATAGREEVTRRLKLPIIIAQIERYLIDSLTLWKSTSLPQYDQL